MLLVAAACGEEAGTEEPGPEALSANAPEVSEREQVLGTFLFTHWQLPTPPQGAVPDGFSEVEASLEPSVCGACHPKQFAEWQTSLHSRAFSPGLLGQLIEGELAAPFQVRHCQSCHAPLAEQQPFGADLRPNPDLDPGLRASGLICATCHVRAHRVYGPPRRPELPPPDENIPHDGFEPRAEYLESRFCSPCHQFFDDPGIAGKPVENTFAEWQSSPQAAEGRQCQDCHMPDRAHLWRGIHDPETVRKAVDVDLVMLEPAGGALNATLVVFNRDVGHAFPTYITPRVYLAIYQIDARGNEIADTRLDGMIARVLDLGRGTETSDTRVFPGESVRLDYSFERAALAVDLVGRITVDPDYHYRGVFDYLMGTLTDEEARALIEEARRQISDSAYVMTEIHRRLPL